MDPDEWRGLLDWLKGTLVKEKIISSEDLEIFEVADSPEEAVSCIKSRVVL